MIDRTSGTKYTSAIFLSMMICLQSTSDIAESSSTIWTNRTTTAYETNIYNGTKSTCGTSRTYGTVEQNKYEQYFFQWYYVCT